MISFLSEYSSLMQAISSVLIASFTSAYVVFTVKSFLQQKKEEKLKYRAYISIVSEELIVDSSPGANFDRIFRFYIQNNGTTPAINVRTSSYYFIDGEKQGLRDFNESPSSYLDPSASREVTVTMRSEDIVTLSALSRNYFIVEIQYQDYSGKEHIFVSKYQYAEYGSEQRLTIVEQYEENTQQEARFKFRKFQDTLFLNRIVIAINLFTIFASIWVFTVSNKINSLDFVFFERALVGTQFVSKHDDVKTLAVIDKVLSKFHPGFFLEESNLPKQAFQEYIFLMSKGDEVKQSDLDVQLEKISSIKDYFDLSEGSSVALGDANGLLDEYLEQKDQLQLLQSRIFITLILSQIISLLFVLRILILKK